MNRREAIERTALILGYAVSAPAMIGVLNGCKAAPELTYRPVFFTEEQARTVGEIAEIIIPKRNLPVSRGGGLRVLINLFLKVVFLKKKKNGFKRAFWGFKKKP